jgi:hypothetical protein
MNSYERTSSRDSFCIESRFLFRYAVVFEDPDKFADGSSACHTAKVRCQGTGRQNGTDSRQEKRDHTDREPDHSAFQSFFAGLGFAFFQYGTDIGCFMATGISGQETELILEKTGL